MKVLLCCSKIFYIKSKSTQNRVLLSKKLNMFIPKISDKIKVMLYKIRRKLNIFSIIDYDVIISTILPIILNENIEKMSIVCQREDNLMLIYIIQLLKILSMI